MGTGNGTEISQNKSQFELYGQTQAGLVRFVGNNNAVNIGATLGGTYKHNNFSATAQVGLGTIANAKVKADYRLPINNNTNIEFGGSVGCNVQTAKTKFQSELITNSNIHHEINVELDGRGAEWHHFMFSGGFVKDDDVSYKMTEADCRYDENYRYYRYHSEYDKSTLDKQLKNDRFHRANLTSELHAGVNFNSKKGSISFGAMAARRDNLNSVEHTYDIKAPTLDIGDHFYVHATSDDKSVLDAITNDALKQGLDVQKTSENTIKIEKDFTSTLEFGELAGKQTVKMNEAKHELAFGVYLNGEKSIDKKGKYRVYGNVAMLNGDVKGKSNLSLVGEVGLKVKLGRK